MRILFLNPIPLHVVWPIPTDFVKFLTYNPPSVTFPQLAACVPDHPCELLDGIARHPPLRDFADILRDKDLVAITVPSNLVSLNAQLNLRLIRRIKPEIKIALGGIHPSIYHREWLAKDADFVVRQDGEETFGELVRALEQGADLSQIPGLSYRQGDELVVNPDRPLIQDLDTLPLPRWDIVDFDQYYNFYGSGRVGVLETSRGCVAFCDFCMASEVWDHTQRYKSPGRVIEEARQLQRLGVNRVWFTDDNFGEDLDRDTELCERMIDEGLGLRWSCFTRADNVRRHPEFYRLAARAGLESVLVGFETLSMVNLARFNKGYRHNTITKQQDYEAIYQHLRGCGVFTIGLFVIGHPEESPEEIRHTLSLHQRVCDFPFFTPFRPETPKFIAGNGSNAGNGPKDYFYFNSLAVYEEQKRYQLQRIAVTLGSFARPGNFGQALWGDAFSRGFYRGLFFGLLRGVGNFHKRMPADLLELMKTPDGITAQRFEQYANRLLDSLDRDLALP